MNYRVEVDPDVRQQMIDAARYIARTAPLNAQRWYEGLEAAIQSLKQMPAACALARENDAFDIELRQLVYKSHRIIFTIRDDIVRVLHVRHTAMLPIDPED